MKDFLNMHLIQNQVEACKGEVRPGKILSAWTKEQLNGCLSIPYFKVAPAISWKKDLYFMQIFITDERWKAFWELRHVNKPDFNFILNCKSFCPDKEVTDIWERIPKLSIKKINESIAKTIEFFNSFKLHQFSLIDERWDNWYKKDKKYDFVRKEKYLKKEYKKHMSIIKKNRLISNFVETMPDGTQMINPYHRS